METVDYDPRLADGLVAALERAARQVGLSLDRLELLGQTPKAARSFVASVALGEHEACLAEIDWAALGDILHERRTATLRAIDELRRTTVAEHR